MPYPLSDFMKFAGTDFESYILPIIPAGAKLTANSTLNEDQLGKIPASGIRRGCLERACKLAGQVGAEQQKDPRALARLAD
jgi:hypothetical protein